MKGLQQNTTDYESALQSAYAKHEVDMLWYEAMNLKADYHLGIIAARSAYLRGKTHKHELIRSANWAYVQSPIRKEAFMRGYINKVRMLHASDKYFEWLG